MKYGVLVILAAAAMPAAAAGEASSYTAKATAACLTSHRVLADAEPRSQVLPPGFPATGALKFTFALIPAQAMDNGDIVFERDSATARRVAERWFRYSLAEAAKVKGVNLPKIKIQLRDVFTVSGNAITVWRVYPAKTASRRLVARCLR